MKLRNKFGVFIVALIAVTIFAFLLQDAISSDTSVLRPDSNKAGVINGKTITIQDFDRKVQEAMQNYRLTNNVMNIDDETSWLIRNQAWEQYVNELLMSEKYDKLGVMVTADELLDMVQGPNPHPAVLQSFSDPQTGRFDPGQVGAFLQQLDNDETGETRTRWLNFERYLKEDRIRTKFNELVKTGMYTPSWLAGENYQISASTVDIDYVFLPFTGIPDSDVTLTDKELQEYLSKNKAKYSTREEMRSIEYITFDIKPTREDTARVKTKLEDLLENFKKTTSDSAFLRSYSQLPYDQRYYGRDELTSTMTDSFFTMEKGEVIGPYLEDGYWKFAKLLDRKMIADSVKAKHLFISIAGVRDQMGVEQKRLVADSLLKEIKENKADFNALVVQFSDNIETKINDGDMGWINPGEQFPTINNALFYKFGKGDIFMVPSDEENKRGFHIIQITEAKPVKDAVHLSILAKEIAASVETERALYSQASKFTAAHQSAQKFREGAKEYNPRQAEGIRKNDNTVQGIGAARDLVKWAYNSSEGAVSDVFSLESKYVVALISKAVKEGVRPFDEVKTEIEVEVRKEKKAEKLKEKVQGQTDLNTIAGATGKTVETATGLSFSNNFIDNVGQEPTVASRALTMNQGETSSAFKGNNGVFVIKVVSKYSPPQLSSFASQQKQGDQAAASLVDFSLMEAIRKSAEVKDERYKFY